MYYLSWLLHSLLFFWEPFSFEWFYFIFPASISLPHLLHNRIVKCSETLNADFDDNVELVTVWADYMSAINWIYKDGDNKWTATDNGKKWLEKCYNTKDVAYE